jgi:uncharacterized protein (TIGR02246 family)
MSTPRLTAAVDTKSDIQKLATDWVNAFNNNDAAAIARLYTDDATLSSTASTDTGRAAIEESLKKLITRMSVSSLTVDRSHRVGDLAYALGAWKGNLKGAEGKDAPVGGHWLAVYQYVDGNYLAMAHIANGLGQ